MKVLLCHNYYSQAGGEDASFEDEARLLESHGHTVVRYTRHSGSVADSPPWDLAWRAIWNPQTYEEVRATIAAERPDVVHCTNTFPLISPAVYHAAHDEGVAVLQALRNYRLICPSAILFRDGKVCESCVGKRLAWPGVVHGCYRGSRGQSAVAAAMLAAHHARRTWSDKVDLYYTPTEFARSRFVAGGIPAHRIAVKPNFVDPDPGPTVDRGEYAVFVGRHSPEKGIGTLIEAWRQLDTKLALLLVGDGPLADEIVTAARRDARIQWLGPRPSSEVIKIVSGAQLLVQPSLWYETFGRTIVEAFACGTPVVVSGLGAMADLVRDGETGLHARPGDAADLAAKVQRVLDDGELRARMRVAARAEYLEKYTAERNYEILMGLYDRALELHGAVRSPARAR